MIWPNASLMSIWDLQKKVSFFTTLQNTLLLFVKLVILLVALDCGYLLHKLILLFLIADNATDDVGIVETSTEKEFTPNGLEVEGRSNMEPYVGMEFESEEAAKAYYSTYATHLGFIMRVDAFRRSMRNGELVWRRLVCNKEGFSKSRQSQNGKKKCRAIREGCKAMIIVKKEQSGKWLVAKLVKEHNHELVVKPVNTPKGAILCQTPVSTSN